MACRLHLFVVTIAVALLTGKISSQDLTSILEAGLTKATSINVKNAPQIGVNAVRETADLIPAINIGLGTVFFRLFDGKRKDVKYYKDISIKDKNVFSIFTPEYGYDPAKLSIFFTHGFIDSTNRDLSNTMAAAFLSRGEYNVFNVDWSKLNLPPYTVAVQNMKTVGETIAQVLNEAIKKQLIKLSDIHLIGHSLGAHLSGYIGRNLMNRPPVIVGLDPAGPEFQTDLVAKKLTYLDGDIVHYIQTNRFVFGADFELGLANYKFNGPAVFQPGCLTPGCSHFRAVYFYAEAVKNPGLYISLPCDSYDQFKEGTCKGRKSVIGFPVDKSAKGIYYISTNDKAPFGRGEEGLKP